MDNKTKVKVAVVIGIIILAIIFIFMVVFVKGNKTSVNKNIPNKNDEGYVDPTQKTSEDAEQKELGSSTTLDNVVGLGIKNGNLVKIKDDLTSTVIRKMENGYKEYCYGDEKAYIVISNEDETVSILEVDLTQTNYPETTILTTADYGIIHNIEYYYGKLYFVSQFGQLIEYSISENYFNAITNINEVSNFTINKTSNNMLISYKSNNENAGVYILDFTSNNFTQIISLSQLPGELILSGTHLVIDVKELESIYIYDMETTSVIGIGPENNNLKQIKNQIAFYDNVLLYTNGANIDIKQISGESYQDGWYTLNDASIAGISMISSTKMQIERFDASGNGQITRSVIIDLSNGVTTEVPDYAYIDVIKL